MENYFPPTWENKNVKIYNFEKNDFESKNYREIEDAIKSTLTISNLEDNYNLLSVNVCPTHNGKYLITVMVEILD